MSTTATTPERSHAPYAEPDEYIDYQLRKTQAGIKRTDMLTAAVVSATMLIGYVLLFVISDHWLFDGGMSRTMRLLMWLPVVGEVGWMIGTKMIWPALRTVSGLFAAKTLEASAPEFRSSLLSLIDLKRSNRPVAPIIMATMEKRAAVTFTKFNVDDAIDKRLLLRTLYVLFGIVVVFCLYSVLNPKKLGPSVLRAMLPFSNVRPATQTEILEVKPGHAKLRAGGSLAIEVQLRGATPPDVRLFFTTADRRFKNEPVELGPTTDTQRYLGTLGQDEQGLLQSFSYFVVAGDARSPDYNVEIITPPSATVTDVRCEFPAYTELDPTTQMGGAIDVWERTAVKITAATNMPVARTESEFSDTQDFAAAASYPGPTPKLDDGGKRLTISWRADPRQAGVVLPGQSNSPFPKFYRVKVWDAEGHPDPKPAVYPINVRIDQPPQVVLLDPKINLEMPVNGIVPLVIAAHDPDFKLRIVSLKIARDGNDVTDETLFDGAQQEVSLQHDFALEPLRLKPGDKVRFWIEAQDNRLPTHGSAKTAPLEITITGRVTKDEAKKQLAEQKQEQQQRIDEALKNNDDGTERTEQQPSDLRDPPEQQARDANESEQRPRPKSDDPNEERPNPDQKDQQPGVDKNAEGQSGSSSKPSEKQQPGGKPDKTQSGGTSKSADPKSNDKSDPSATQKPGGEQSLKNDGTDDDRALQKIADREQRRGRWPKNKPQDSSANNPPQNSDNNPSDKPMPDDDSDNANKPSSPDKQRHTQDKPNKPDKQPGQPGEKTEQPDAPQADSDPANKPNPDADPSAKPNESNDDKKPTKPGTSKSPPDKSPKNNDPDKPQSPTGDDPKPSDSAADKPDSDSGAKPKDKSKDQDKKRPGGNDPKAANDADKSNDPGDKKPMPGEGDDKQQPGSPKKDNSDKPNSDPKGEGSDKKKPATGSDDEKPTQPNDDKKPSGKQPPSDNADDMNSTDKADKPGNQKPKPKSADKNATPDKDSPDDKADSPKKPSQGKKPDDKQNDSADKPGQESPDDIPQSDKKQSDKPQSDKPQSDKKQPSPDGEKSPDGKPSADEDKGPKGKDEKSKSDKPGDSDKPGKPDEAGKSPSDKPGDKPGDGDSEGESKDGKPSGKPKASKGSPSNKKPDGPLGKGSGGTGGGAVPGDAEQSDGRGQPGDKDAKPTRKQSDQSGSGAGSSEDEPANEQFTKEAANLVLKRLQGELKRGEVDQELLDELGWTPEQMKKFLERMEPNFEAKPDDNSPAAKARRRQFEEMLRNLDLTSKSQRRDDTNKIKQSGEGIGSVRRPPPPHLREWWESYTKGLSKKQAAEPPKK